MNNKDQLIYILNEKLFFEDNINHKNNKNFSKQVFELKKLLFLILEELLKSKVKANVLELFNNKYQIIYQDILKFISGENILVVSEKISNYLYDQAIEIKKDFIYLFNKYNDDLDDNFYLSILNEFNKNPKIYYEQSRITDKTKQLSNNKFLGGKIMSVQDDQEYTNLINTLLGAGFQYNGISIKETKEEIKLYFY